MSEENENVNHPKHYKSNRGIEAIDVIEAFELGFNLGNVAKYILRAGKKGPALEDLEKAKWYLEREIGAYKHKQYGFVDMAGHISDSFRKNVYDRLYENLRLGLANTQGIGGCELPSGFDGVEQDAKKEMER